MAKSHARRTGKKPTNQRRTGKKSSNQPRQVASIDILPDEVLLPTFDFYVDEAPIHAWHSLVHVCRRWRRIVFGSPRRLDLRLFCTAKTPTRDTLDVWPSLPLLIRVDDYQTLAEDVDNVVAVLERRDRVCLIGLWGLTSPLEKVLTAMQEPFPELVDLVLESSGGTVPVFPDSFMGGFTPRLQSLWLDRIPFPGLPKLLLSATHLVNLHLLHVPPSGYISPEVMVTTLSLLTSLETLKLELQSPRSHPGSISRRSPPPTHTIPLVLIQFWFQGDSKYSEDFLARIDTPQLDFFYIAFCDQIVSDTAQFIQFINRTSTLKTLERACVVFEDNSANVNFSSQTSGYRELDVRIRCSDFNWELLSLERVFTSSLPPLSTSEDLYISEAAHSQPDWLDAIGTVWLDLLCPFTAVKNLYLSKQVAPHVVSVLQGLVGDRTIEVFPNLQNIFLEKLRPSKRVQKGINQFVAMRQVTGHPIAVSRWDRGTIGFDGYSSPYLFGRRALRVLSY